MVIRYTLLHPPSPSSALKPLPHPTQPPSSHLPCPPEFHQVPGPASTVLLLLLVGSQTPPPLTPGPSPQIPRLTGLAAQDRKGHLAAQNEHCLKEQSAHSCGTDPVVQMTKLHLRERSHHPWFLGWLTRWESPTLACPSVAPGLQEWPHRAGPPSVHSPLAPRTVRG